jgi:hypothetical protein
MANNHIPTAHRDDSPYPSERFSGTIRPAMRTVVKPLGELFTFSLLVCSLAEVFSCEQIDASNS